MEDTQEINYATCICMQIQNTLWKSQGPNSQHPPFHERFLSFALSSLAKIVNIPPLNNSPFPYNNTAITLLYIGDNFLGFLQVDE